MDATLVRCWKYSPAKTLRPAPPDVGKIGELLARELLLLGFQVGNRVRPIVGRLAVHSSPAFTPQRSYDMSSYKAVQQSALIAVFAAVMAAVVWPAPASAQYPYPEGCAWCVEEEDEEGVYHRFQRLGMNYRCNTNKGCHGLKYKGEACS